MGVAIDLDASAAAIAVALDLGEAALVRPGSASGLPWYIDIHADRLRRDENAAIAWLRARKTALDHVLAHHGGVVIRGLPLADAEGFSRFIRHYPDMPQGYAGGAARRIELADRIYDTTSTRAASFKTRLHQEMAYMDVYPLQIAFFCRLPAETGGETPVADARRLESLLPVELKQAVSERGLCYLRSFRAPDQPLRAPAHLLHQLPGFYRTWDDVFGTTDRSEVEQVLRETGLECEWLPGGGLTTRRYGQGFADHPLTGEPVWFNALSLQHGNHVQAGMTPKEYAQVFPGGLPRAYDVTFADGGAIAGEDVLALYDLQDAITVAPQWRAGDLMVLDNVMTMHGGNPYTGERDVQVSMFH